MLTTAAYSFMQAQWAEAISHENEKLHQLSELQRGIIADLQRQGGAPDLAAAEAPAGPRRDTRSHSAMHAEHPSEVNSPVRGHGFLTEDGSDVVLQTRRIE